METQTFQKQYPLALIALGEHIRAYGLPAPLDVFVVEEYRDGAQVKAIRLHLPGQHTHQAWIDTVAVDGRADEPADGSRGIRTQWDVRLPDSGFRFQVVGFAHSQLVGVPA